MSSFRKAGRSRLRARQFLACGMLVCTTSAALPARAAAQTTAQAAALSQDLKRLSIEELMGIDVTTATRRAEPVGETPAAISVITSDDIRRSGLTTLADALLLADGVHVARFNSSTWAITARGFNQTTANKLLVMIDGRTVYSPLFAGVFWNTHDYVLDDVDRIEVIRGPGATLWGANAVNGVINIITRSARQTQGTLVALSAGNEDRAIAEVRHGGAVGGAAWRVYGKVAGRDAQALAGASAGDGRRRGQTGFRVDGGSVDGINWLVNGDLFHSDDDQPDRRDAEFTNGSLQARWSTPLSTTSRVTVQSYYQREYRRVPLQLTHHIDTFDVDAQHTTSTPRHAVVWGGGFRHSLDKVHDTPALGFDPDERTYRIANVFVQDDVTLVPDRLFATVGVKYEHNAFSGGEVQPNVRLRATLPSRQFIWGAVSRAVRRPTRFEADLTIPNPDGTIAYVGNEDFLPESLLASELGYRIQPGTFASIDVTAFHHHIDDLRSVEAPLGPGLPLTTGNSLHGRSAGVETAVNLQPASWWRAHVGYTWLDTDIERSEGSRDISGGVTEANDPSHLLAVRTSLDLPNDIELDAMFRRVGALPNPAVPAIKELSLRLGWHVDARAEVFIAGQDLLHDQHSEFGAGPSRVEFERAVRAGLTLKF